MNGARLPLRHPVEWVSWACVLSALSAALPPGWARAAQLSFGAVVAPCGLADVACAREAAVARSGSVAAYLLRAAEVVLALVTGYDLIAAVYAVVRP